MTGERPGPPSDAELDVPVVGRVPSGRRRVLKIGPILPERMRRQRRPRLWQEIIFIALSYIVYTYIRNNVPKHETTAQNHASWLFSTEKKLGLDVELAVNKFVAGVHWGGWHWLADVCDYYYATMHFVIVITVLIWVYVQHPMNYRSTRTALYAANGLAAAVFWLYPLAPPRLMEPSQNFIDTVVIYHTWGSWGSADFAKISNQYAAMPSLHIGWSLWAGLTIFMLSRRWWLRILGLAYPLATLMVIIGTANHFVLDAVGGVLVLAAGFFIQRLLTGRRAYELPPIGDGPATTPAPSRASPTRRR